jgi:hypothetical protein
MARDGKGPDSECVRAAPEELERGENGLLPDRIRSRRREIVPEDLCGGTPPGQRQVNDSRLVTILVGVRAQDPGDCDRQRRLRLSQRAFGHLNSNFGIHRARFAKKRLVDTQGPRFLLLRVYDEGTLKAGARLLPMGQAGRHETACA